MAFLLHGGLVELCHTAAETHILHLVCLQGKQKKEVAAFTFVICIMHCCNGFIPFQLQKKRKNFIVNKKIETMCSTNYWLGEAIAMATMSTEFWLRERGPC